MQSAAATEFFQQLQKIFLYLLYIAAVMRYNKGSINRIY